MSHRSQRPWDCGCFPCQFQDFIAPPVEKLEQREGKQLSQCPPLGRSQARSRVSPTSQSCAAAPCPGAWGCAGRRCPCSRAPGGPASR